VASSMTLWYLSLYHVVGRFGTNDELNAGKGIITAHFGFMARYHNVPLLGLD